MSAAGHTVEKDLLVNNKYRITRRIGGGSFGEIYEGIGPKNKKVCKFFSQFCIIMTIFNFIFMNKLY